MGASLAIEGAAAMGMATCSRPLPRGRSCRGHTYRRRNHGRGPWRCGHPAPPADACCVWFQSNHTTSTATSMPVISNASADWPPATCSRDLS